MTLQSLPEYDSIDSLMREFIRHKKMLDGIAVEGVNHITLSANTVGLPVATPKLYQPQSPLRPDSFADAAAYEMYRISFNAWLANKTAFDNSATDYTKRINDMAALTNVHATRLVNTLSEYNLLGVSFTATEDDYIVLVDGTAVYGENPDFHGFFPYANNTGILVHKIALSPIE